MRYLVTVKKTTTEQYDPTFSAPKHGPDGVRTSRVFYRGIALGSLVEDAHGKCRFVAGDHVCDGEHQQASFAARFDGRIYRSASHARHAMRPMILEFFGDSPDS